MKAFYMLRTVVI